MGLHNLTLEKAKSELKTKMNEYQMLNKTLVEMYEKGTSDIVVDTLKDDINETLDTINGLKDWIEKETDKDENVEYSFYDGIEKPKLAKSVRFTNVNLYDSIKKEDSSDEERKLNYKDLYDKTLKFLNSETSEKYLNDTITTANRFLVRFSNPLRINEWMVKSVDFDSIDKKELLITLQDHLVTRENGTRYPIVSELRGRALPNTSSFNISIDYLDRTGYTLYTERYHNCKITDVVKSSLSYEAEGFNTIQLTVAFSEITYETSH